MAGPPRLPASPAAAIAEGGLLAHAFQGPSWDRWRAVLKAAYGEPLDAAELALFRQFAGGRDPPPQHVRELWCVAGRWSGKDSIASAIAAVAALRDYRPHLRPGERATVACLAADKTQARIVHRYVAGYFADNSLLARLVERESDDGLELSNGVEIVISTNSYRSIRGRTIVCAILDEVAYWRDETSASPDTELYAALLPAMVRVPGSTLIGISTPYKRGGLLYQRWQRHFGKDDDDVLVVHGATPLFNPTCPQRIIDQALADDPERAGAEWLAEWRGDISDFLDRQLIESAVDPGVIVRPPQAGVAYRAFVDASGGRGSSFTAAIARPEGDQVVVDALYERRSPFDPGAVVGELAKLLQSYGVGTVAGDKYAAGWVVEAFHKEGIKYEASERDRSALYLDALPLFTAGRVRLVDNPRAVHQFASLERRVTRFGRDRVGHPDRDGGADDLANSIAGCVVLVALDQHPTLIRREHLLREDGAPVAVPRGWNFLHAVVVVGMDGQCGVVYFLSQHWLGQHDRSRAVLVDFGLVALAADTFLRVHDRIQELFSEHDVTVDAVIYVQRELEAQVRARGVPCDVIDKKWLADSEALALSVASHVLEGKVKIAVAAHEKSKRVPLSGALIFQGGRVGCDPLRLAWLVGVKLAMGD